MRTQLIELLNSLSEGSEMILRFPTSGERERFRQAIYKEKKDWDDLNLMTDPDFETTSLRFQTSQNDQGEFFAKLKFYTPEPSPLQFTIVEQNG